jgi:hypothetical protein
MRNSRGPIRSIRAGSRGVPPSSGKDHEISWRLIGTVGDERFGFEELQQPRLVLGPNTHISRLLF